MTSADLGILSALTELTGALLLAAGAATPPVASPFVAQAVVSVVRAHRSRGDPMARRGERGAHAP